MSREKVELVTGDVFFSDDGWATVWKEGRGPRNYRVTDKDEADRIRYIALVQHGGGRDDEPRRKR